VGWAVAAVWALREELAMDRMMERIGNFYWLVAGGLLGFGLMAIFSVGLPIFLFGLIMVMYKVRRSGDKGFGLVLVGMGLVPAAYLLLAYFTADRSSTFYSVDAYSKGVLVYIALALAGGVLVLIEARRASNGHGKGSDPGRG
jgi:hypothetical protein